MRQQRTRTAVFQLCPWTKIDLASSTPVLGRLEAFIVRPVREHRFGFSGETLFRIRLLTLDEIGRRFVDNNKRREQDGQGRYGPPDERKTTVAVRCTSWRHMHAFVLVSMIASGGG
uniref:Uncharacterized protein n=1 Tax=Acrobeloides nanus TaxID=290746 RepID=A0A914CU39_9BILA